MSKTVFYLLLFLLCNIIISFLGINISDGWNPVGLYSEPSHVAIFLAPLLIFSTKNKIKGNVFFILFFLLWGALDKNLTTILVVCFSSLFYIVNFKYFTRVVVVFIFTTIIIIPYVDSNYFTSRINLTKDTDSVSSLVFLRGWENAVEAFENTNGLGIGYQQLGYSNKIKYKGFFSRRLDSYNLGELNKYDGGSLTPKIISEFGIIGILIVLFYLYFFLKLIKPNKSKQYSGGAIFLHCCYFGFLFELFVRGAGYFTIGTFLFLASTVNLNFSRIR